MGGWGSGRHASHGTTQHRPVLDVRWLQRAGLLTPTRRSHWQWLQAGATLARVCLLYTSDAADE